MINILADSGLGSGFNAVGGRLLSNRQLFAALAQWIRRRRAVYAGLAGLIVLPAIFGLLYANDARLITSISVVGLVAFTALATTEAVVYVAAHKLRARIRPLLKAELTGSGVRLVLVLVVSGLRISVAIAIGCSLVSQWARLLLLRRQSTDLETVDARGAEAWTGQLNSIVRHSLPLVIFYCFQGQIATFILSIFATSSDVADLGALTRFNMVFAWFALPLGYFVFPAISRCPEGVRLRRIVLRTIASGSISFGGLALLGASFSPLLLWMLGPQYAHLRTELALYLGGLAIASCGDMVWSILLARGWVHLGWIQIPLALALMVGSAQWLEFDSTSSAIIFAALGGVARLCSGVVLVARNLPQSGV